jgi:hypothetical protein
MKKVVATSTGFYQGSRIRPGTEFEVPDDFKGSWVAAVDSPAAAPAKAKPARVEPKTLSEMARVAVKAPTDIA